MKVGKYVVTDCFDEVIDRFVTVDVELKGTSEKEVEDNFLVLAEKLEEMSNVTIEWSTCATVEEDKGTWIYQDMFTLEYEHGFMTEIKKDLMADFRAIKKEMGLR